MGSVRRNMAFIYQVSRFYILCNMFKPVIRFKSTPLDFHVSSAEQLKPMERPCSPLVGQQYVSFGPKDHFGPKGRHLVPAGFVDCEVHKICYYKYGVLANGL